MLKERFLKALVAEDLGRGDLFSRISESKPIRAYILAKSDGVFAGQEYIEAFAKMYDFSLEWKVSDGMHFKKGEKLIFYNWGRLLVHDIHQFPMFRFL